jgi:mannosylglycerate hydrolase
VTSAPPQAAAVHLVPHTHWDREWYLPFQTFRIQLVDLVDRVLALLESDPRFAFTLDGQLATVDDYLEVRPEAEGRVRGLVEQGRLAIGPWQILMDEFLVSGETIVRNLEAGSRRGEELGGVVPAGYLPDMFGHIAQMPQILRRAGIAHALVWRGVPAAIDRSAFRWVAPDGSSVRAEYLVHGYFGAAYVFELPERVAARVELLDQALRPFFGEKPLLAMYGTDHSEPLPQLLDVVDQVNASQGRYRLNVVTLAEYVRSLDRAEADLPEWRGELRSGARANLLPGVVSARVDLKAACGRAERALERYAEPFQALHCADWPGQLFTLAWSRVIENSAHDSICGCSHDEVAAQVLVRYSEAEQIASGLASAAAKAVARRVPAGAVAILNPSPHERTDVVLLDLPIPDPWEEVALELPDGTRAATQEMGRSPTLLRMEELPGRDIPERLFRRLHGRELFRRSLNAFDLDEVDGRRRITFEVGEEPDPLWLDVDELRREVALAVQAAADEPWLVRIVARPRRTLAVAVPAPALGWTSVRPARGSGSIELPVAVGPRSLEHGHVAVEVAPDGTLTVAGGGVTVDGVGRLVDGGDFGDSYNYAPPLADTLVESPEEVHVEARAHGPVRGELAVVRSYRWPLGVDPDGATRSREAALVQVTTHVELRAAEPFVRLRISFDNPCDDHRLRFHVPLAAAARTSVAEGQFAVVERSLRTEGGYGEVPLGTYPAHGFVDAGGIAVLLDHVLEYELVESGELALTLLRATGLVSRNDNPYREDPAGPELAIPQAQGRGARSVSFGLYPHAGSWTDAGVPTQLEHYRHPFVSAPGTGRAHGLLEERGLEVTGDGVVLSSLRRRDGWLELRLVCERAVPSTALVSGGFREAREVDLRGRPLRELALEDEAVRLNLGAWEICSVQLKR